MNAQCIARQEKPQWAGDTVRTTQEDFWTAPSLLYRAPTHRPAFCCHPEPLEGRFRATAISLDSPDSTGHPPKGVH